MLAALCGRCDECILLAWCCTFVRVADDLPAVSIITMCCYLACSRRWTPTLADRRRRIAGDRDPRISSVNFRCGGGDLNRYRNHPSNRTLRSFESILLEW